MLHLHPHNLLVALDDHITHALEHVERQFRPLRREEHVVQFFTFAGQALAKGDPASGDIVRNALRGKLRELVTR